MSSSSCHRQVCAMSSTVSGLEKERESATLIHAGGKGKRVVAGRGAHPSSFLPESVLSFPFLLYLLPSILISSPLSSVEDLTAFLEFGCLPPSSPSSPSSSPLVFLAFFLPSPTAPCTQSDSPVFFPHAHRIASSFFPQRCPPWVLLVTGNGEPHARDAFPQPEPEGDETPVRGQSIDARLQIAPSLLLSCPCNVSPGVY